MTYTWKRANLGQVFSRFLEFMLDNPDLKGRIITTADEIYIDINDGDFYFPVCSNIQDFDVYCYIDGFSNDYDGFEKIFRIYYDR